MGWGGWLSLSGSITGSPSPVYDKGDGPTNVFSLGADGPLFYIFWNGSGWQPWKDLDVGGDLTGSPAGIDDPASGYLEAFALDSSGSVFPAFHDDGVWESETLGNTDASGAIVNLAGL